MAGLILAFLMAGLLILSGRVLLLWLKERRASPGSGIPLRHRFYGMVGTASALAFLAATDFRYPGAATMILILVPSLLKGIEQLFLWTRRDEHPPGLDHPGPPS